ncbi:hypothetical protein FLJC2902T_13820 [Flavobacterium limnosediminis JC2902]|uniref:Uncharacterized protein n=1 Tax=Flavobacterium limnosediminis JC2902 TaxID=1341181 RepID=V6SWK2_9FLAO|nr:hypothetical protein FLJC2902T_13820 [Flavobacterium limnosediminis JC2902]
MSHDKKYDVKRNIAEDYSFAKKIVRVKKKTLRLKRNQKADGGLIDEGLAV